MKTEPDLEPMMNATRQRHRWFFVDEAGDPTFYDAKGRLIVGQKGCSPLLILGFAEVQRPEDMRRAIRSLQIELISDPDLAHLPSVLRHTSVALHAKADHARVRKRVFSALNSLDFKVQFVVARKIERVFLKRFKASERAFYDGMFTVLFESQLHLAENNHIYYATRGSRARQTPIAGAIAGGIARFEQKWQTQVQTSFEVIPESPKGEPCLSLTDYANWAVYRAFTTGDMSFYRMIEGKVSFLLDLYDTAIYPRNYYSRKNPFDIAKATPLQLGSSSERTA